MILCLKNRQHCLPASRCPAPEDDRNLIGIDQLLGLLCKCGPIGCTIFSDGCDLVALAIDLDAPRIIDLFDGHLFNFFESGLRDSHCSTQRVEDANLNLAIKVSATATTTTGGESESQTESRNTTDPPSRGGVLCQRLHETAPKKRV